MLRMDGRDPTFVGMTELNTALSRATSGDTALHSLGWRRGGQTPRASRRAHAQPPVAQ
jgi:hypothetical protein